LGHESSKNVANELADSLAVQNNSSAANGSTAGDDAVVASSASSTMDHHVTGTIDDGKSNDE
jgi:hypothetical protein